MHTMYFDPIHFTLLPFFFFLMAPIYLQYIRSYSIHVTHIIYSLPSVPQELLFLSTRENQTSQLAQTM